MFNSTVPDVNEVGSINQYAEELRLCLAEIRTKIEVLEQLSSVETLTSKAWYFCDDAQPIAGWHELEPVPQLGTVGSHTITTTANTFTQFDRYLSDPIGVTTIPAGDWIFNTWINLTSLTGTNQVQVKVYTVTAGGVATERFTGASILSDDIAETDYHLLSFRSTELGITGLNATDRVGIAIGFLATTVRTVTFSHDIASGRVSSVSCPLNS